MAQYTWTLTHGDTLPHIAEQCGHSGEWSAILESSPFLVGLDYMAIAPETSILLPDGWLPPGASESDIEVAAPPSRSTRSSTTSSKDE